MYDALTQVEAGSVCVCVRVCACGGTNGVPH